MKQYLLIILIIFSVSILFTKQNLSLAESIKLAKENNKELQKAGAEMRQPLGVVSIGGIIVSTLLTLYVIPALYYLTTKKNLKLEERV